MLVQRVDPLPGGGAVERDGVLRDRADGLFELAQRGGR